VGRMAGRTLQTEGFLVQSKRGARRKAPWSVGPDHRQRSRWCRSPPVPPQAATHMVHFLLNATHRPVPHIARVVTIDTPSDNIRAVVQRIPARMPLVSRSTRRAGIPAKKGPQGDRDGAGFSKACLAPITVALEFPAPTPLLTTEAQTAGGVAIDAGAVPLMFPAQRNTADGVSISSDRA